MEFVHHWWALALRGVLAILFGVLTFLWPGLLWLAIVYIFAAYALLDGVMASVMAVTGHGRAGRWWALLLQGIVGIVAGILAAVWPDIAEVAMIYLIAAWYLLVGVLEIVAGIELRKHLRGEWALILSGVLAAILGLAMVAMPVAGLLVIAWWIAANSLVFGMLMLLLAFRLRNLHRHTSRPEAVDVAGTRTSVPA